MMVVVVIVFVTDLVSCLEKVRGECVRHCTVSTSGNEGKRRRSRRRGTTTTVASSSRCSVSGKATTTTKTGRENVTKCGGGGQRDLLLMALADKCVCVLAVCRTGGCMCEDCV